MFYATIDLADLERLGVKASARILSRLVGRTPRLSPIATNAALCDSQIIPVLFHKGQPIAIGDPQSEIPEKVRRAVITRDQACRGPGCNAPAGWCDVHHVLGRKGPVTLEVLALLCRRCHRRIHHFGWTMRMLANGTFHYRRRGKDFYNLPRNRPPPSG